jgi:hypothetical protein
MSLASPPSVPRPARPSITAKAGKFYRPRNHEAFPFFKAVRERFDGFEKVYDERFRDRFGFWHAAEFRDLH